MTGLTRTDLTTPQKRQLAVLALAGQGKYGTVSALGRKFDVSRETVVAAREAGATVLDGHFGRAGQEAGYLRVDDALIERAIVTLRVTGPYSERDIEDVLPILYGIRWSYGTIQGVLADAERRAARFNGEDDLAGIRVSALDEMFSQGQPVLAGIDLESGYLHSLALRASRSAQDWAEVLGQGRAQGLDLYVVVKDAAPGIAAGVREVFPEAEQRDDCFHVLYEVGKVQRRLERRAWSAISREYEASEKLERARARGSGDISKLELALRRAREASVEAIARFDAVEKQARRLADALEPVDLASGRVRTMDDVRDLVAEIGHAIASAPDSDCPRVGHYIENRAPGLALHMGDLCTCLDDLARTWGTEEVALAMVFLRLLRTLRSGAEPWNRHEHLRYCLGVLALLEAGLGRERTEELAGQVQYLLAHRYRASSAIEGFNSTLRPYLYVHKGVSQGFLDLFRFYFNHRIRRWGRHKGTSAASTLQNAPERDWLTLLGYPRSSAAN